MDGELLTDPDAPAVVARDHGPTVGDGVFEVLRVVDGWVFATGLHLDRMTRSARGLGLRPEVDEPIEVLTEAASEASWPPPPATSSHPPLGRPRAGRSGPVTTEVGKVRQEREAELLEG